MRTVDAFDRQPVALDSPLSFRRVPELVVTFNEFLAAARSPSSGAFTVKKTPAGGAQETVSLSGSPSIGGAAAGLSPANALASTDTGVKVSYTKPRSGTDNKLGEFADRTVSSATPSMSVSSSSIAEAAGTSTVTLGTGAGPALTTDQSITLTVRGTAMETDDHTIVGTSPTLTARATAVTAAATAMRDRIDGDAETVSITDDAAAPTPSISVSSIVDDAARNGSASISRRTMPSANARGAFRTPRAPRSMPDRASFSRGAAERPARKGVRAHRRPRTTPGLRRETGGNSSSTRVEPNGSHLARWAGSALPRCLVRALKSPPGPPRKERARAVRPAVRASRINGTGMFRAFLLLTLLSLPAPVLAQTIDYLISISNVTESVVEGGKINFTVNRYGIGPTDLDVKVDLVPVSPIDGFHVLSRGDDTDGASVTVTIPAGELSASGWMGTTDNFIVNEDVAITVSIDDSPSEYFTVSTDPDNLAESATTTVRNGTDVYVTGVRLPSPKHVSDTVIEGAPIELQFMRCVGLANTEVIRSCDDVGSRARAGAKAPPALTESIIVEGRGNFFIGALPSSVSFEAGSFSKTVQIGTVNDSIAENHGGLVVRTFAGSTLANRYVNVAIRDNDRVVGGVDSLVWLANVTQSVDEGGTINFTVRRFGSSVTDLEVKVDIAPVSPISGFNIISGERWGRDGEALQSL